VSYALFSDGFLLLFGSFFPDLIHHKILRLYFIVLFTNVTVPIRCSGFFLLRFTQVGQIFYRTTSTNFNETDSIRFNIRPGTHEYVVEIGSISADFLRIDIGVNGSAVTLRDIRFYIDIDDSLDINPFRYRGKYFDRETGNYYLQARYYNPVLGRFTQPDPFWNTGNMIFGNDPQDPLGLGRYTPDILAVMQSSNLYVYCINNPVMFYDPSGLVVTVSSASPVTRTEADGSITHHISTTVSLTWFGSVTVNWWVTDTGFIQFDFHNNNYWGIIWRGGSGAFAAEMFNVTRGINSNFLSGRTIVGLEADMNIHWAFSHFNHPWDPFVARIGGTNRNMPGFDSNAFVFEATAAISVSASIVSGIGGNPFASILALSRIIREFRGNVFR